jgi:hypothetical protein
MQGLLWHALAAAESGKAAPPTGDAPQVSAEAFIAGLVEVPKVRLIA